MKKKGNELLEQQSRRAELVRNIRDMQSRIPSFTI
jgi:hypothetical protein